ncbi:MAG: hypothetical protein D6815_03810, partial [Candidatus Dadabacteria bacterium]
IEPIDQPSMGGEDFAEYLSRAPGCLARLGVAPPEGRAEMLHSPRFDVDERAIGLGAKILGRAVLEANRLVGGHEQ